MASSVRGAEPNGLRFVDPLGAHVPYDGVSPITWYLAANVLVVRDGKVLMVRQPPAWLDPRDLSPSTTRSLHWPALQKAGLV